MSTWIRPVDGGSISDTFEGHKNRAKPALNPGIDYAVGTGTPVKAVADGTVTGIVNTFTGSGGRMIFLSFPSGHTADYLHLSRIDVQPGQAVKQGQVLGLSGGSEHTFTSHSELAVSQQWALETLTTKLSVEHLQVLHLLHQQRHQLHLLMEQDLILEEN